MWTRAFWRAAAERAVKTFAQFLLVLLIPAGTSAVAVGLNVFAVDWGYVLGCSLGGLLVSVLMSVASAWKTGDDSPSLVSTGRHTRPE